MCVCADTGEGSHTQKQQIVHSQKRSSCKCLNKISLFCEFLFDRFYNQQNNFAQILFYILFASLLLNIYTTSVIGIIPKKSNKKLIKHPATYHDGAGVWEADLRREEASPTSASPVCRGRGGGRGGEQLRGEELLQVGAQDAQVRGVVDASPIDGALQQTVDKLPLEGPAG